jgi:hypothetical protein
MGFIRSGKIRDAKTIIAIQAYELRNSKS